MPVEECAASNCVQVTQVPTCSWNRWGELSVQGTEYQEVVEVIEIPENLCCCWGTEHQQWGQVESCPSRHWVGMTHQPHCLCMNGATLEASAKLGYPHKRGSLEHIKIQGNGGGKERIQRSPVCFPHAASAPSTGRLGRQEDTPNSVRLPPGYSSQCHSGLSILSPEWPTLTVQKLKKGKGRAQQSCASLSLSFAISWEKEGTGFYSFRRGSRLHWWWGRTALYVLRGWVVTVLPHYLLPSQKMHIF